MCLSFYLLLLHRLHSYGYCTVRLPSAAANVHRTFALPLTTSSAIETVPEIPVAGCGGIPGQASVLYLSLNGGNGFLPRHRTDRLASPLTARLNKL